MISSWGRRRRSDRSLPRTKPRAGISTTAFEALSNTKVRDNDLLLGMVDKTADLRAIRTTDKQLRYVLADNLTEFKKTHQILEDLPAWEGDNAAC